MAGFLNTAVSKEPSSSYVVLVQNDEGKKELETLRKLEIDQMCGIDIDVSKYYVTGLITTAYPSFETKIRKTKKLVLKSCDLQQPSTSSGRVHSVSVFIIGDGVNKCDILKPNDMIIIKGFTLEKPSVTGDNFQIIVNLQHAEAKIWMVKCKTVLPSQTKQLNGIGVLNLDKTNIASRNDINVASNDKLKSADDHEKPNRSKNTTNEEEISSATNEQHKLIVAGGKKLRILQLPPKPHYTKFADLQVNEPFKEHKIVNVFGIVRFFKTPNKTKGKNYCMVVSLVDDSLKSTEDSFLCTIFAPLKEQLPVIKCVGDIVRFERVKISKFNGEVVGTARELHSWLVFDGFPDTPITPTASSTNNYTLDEQDKTVIQNLKTFALLHEVSPKKTLAQIKPENSFVNISCQVVSICEGVHSLVLTVWDGTFPEYQPYSVEEIGKNTLVVSNALKEESARMTINVCLYDEHSYGEAKNLSPKDFVMLVNVHVKPGRSNSEIRNQDVLSFVMHNGSVNGRGVYKLSLDSRDVKQIQNQIASFKGSRYKHQNKQAGLQQTENTTDNKTTTVPRTLQTSCTITDFPCIPFTSIEAVKKCLKVPNKFRCRVKAMAFLPNNIMDFVQRCCKNCKTVQMSSSNQRNCKEPTAQLLDGQNGPRNQDKASEKDETTAAFDKPDEVTSRNSCKDDCKAKDTLLEGTESNAQDPCQETSPICSVCHQETRLVYVFSLLIEDPTGILHVMFFDSDATYFLIELPTPEEFLRSPETQEMIRDSLVSITDNQTNELTAESQPEGSRPWMECCVLSYKIDQVVLYRIFGTTLI